MANLYELKAEYITAIEEAFDEETGEILDPERLAQAGADFWDKVENVMCYIKNLKADAVALKEEKQKLAERQKVKENKAERLSKYLQDALEGQTFESPRGKISYRKSAALEVDMEEFMKNESAELYLKYKEPELNKEAIKKAIKEGQSFEGAEIIERQNMQIK